MGVRLERFSVEVIHDELWAGARACIEPLARGHGPEDEELPRAAGDFPVQEAVGRDVRGEVDGGAVDQLA